VKPSNSELKRLLKRIGDNIKRIRSERKLTQEQIEGRGFNTRWLQYLEAGSRNINMSTLLKLSQALRVPVSEFFKE